MNFDSNLGCAAIRKRRKDEERDEDQFAVGVFSFCRFDIGGSDDVIGRRSFIHAAASFVLVFSFSSYWFSVFLSLIIRRSSPLTLVGLPTYFVCMILVIACPFGHLRFVFLSEAIDWAGGVAAAPQLIRSRNKKKMGR